MAAVPHVLITGASSGLGAALARRYAAEGCALSLFGRHVARLEAVAGDCRLRAAHVGTFVCDVRDAAGMAGRLREADDRRPVDVLIANAGIGGSDALASPTGEEGAKARLLIETDTIGVINTVAPLLPAMTCRRSGRIVLVGSMAGLIGLPDSPAYCAAKAAVHAYGEALGRLLRRSGVGVTVVCPGFVETPMSASLGPRRPLLWSADAAAARIAGAVAARRRMVAFPWQFRLAIGAMRLLPAGLADRLLELGRARGPGP